MNPLSEIFKLVEANEEADFALFGSEIEAVFSLFLTFYIESTRKCGRNHFLIGQNSSDAFKRAAQKMPEMGAFFEKLPLDESGIILAETVAESITPRTGLLSLPMASPLTGRIQPLDEIRALCDERGIYLHLDATSLLGKAELSFTKSGARFLSFQLESMCALFLSESEFFSLAVNPFDVKKLEAFHKKLESVILNQSYIASEIAYKKLKFEEELGEQVKDLVIHFPHELKLPHLAAFTFPHVHAAALSFLLKRRGIATQSEGSSLISFDLLENPSSDEVVEVYHRLLKGAFR